MYSFSTLFIKDLVFFGRHGATGREILDPQRFKVDINLEVNTLASETSDTLSDTYDYKEAELIAKKIIEGPHKLLIEVLAADIAEEVCEHPKIASAEVTITKLDAHSQGIPGITIRKKRIIKNKDTCLLDFDIHKILKDLETVGGTSFPLLTEDYRKELLAEAETYTYHKQEEIVWPHKVREQLSSVRSFPSSSKFHAFMKDFEKIILHKLEKAGINPFAVPLNFTELSLQLYEKGSLGITPHRDWSSQVNLICNVMLTGTAKFAVCDDRDGNNPKYLDTTPGNMTILRAPGFMNSDIRPFHFVTDVTERRIVFGIRQDIGKK